MKKYRIRPYSIIWWTRAVGGVALFVVYAGLMNSWDLGLL